MKQLHITFSGRVQGVGFRSFVEQEVRKYENVTGYVRNTEDKRVEVLLEGEETKLREIYVTIQEGPPSADVQHAEGKWLNSIKKHYNDFSVLMDKSYE